MLQVFTILGARPQFIKAPPLHRAFRNLFPGYVDEAFIHTGQHYDDMMSGVFFRELGIPEPMYNLNVGSGPHGAQTGKMMEAIETLLLNHQPHLVVVYGDTNSTLAGSLAASKLKIPVAHIEAGLRSHNFSMPEEINRTVTDRISTLLFTPTRAAWEILHSEGRAPKLKKNEVPGPARPGAIFSGDVMYDNILYYAQHRDKEKFSPKINELITGEYIYCTLHRASNTDDPKALKKIMQSLREVSSVFNINLIFPAHPRTAKALEQLSKGKSFGQDIFIIPPVSYLESIALLEGCRLVITDSGGLQKEACFMKKPCVILREETEWVELINSGAGTLAGTDKEKIIQASENYLYNTTEVAYPALFGDGNAGEIIAKEIVNFLHKCYDL